MEKDVSGQFSTKMLSSELSSTLRVEKNNEEGAGVGVDVSKLPPIVVKTFLQLYRQVSNKEKHRKLRIARSRSPSRKSNAGAASNQFLISKPSNPLTTSQTTASTDPIMLGSNPAALNPTERSVFVQQLTGVYGGDDVLSPHLINSRAQKNTDKKSKQLAAVLSSADTAAASAAARSTTCEQNSGVELGVRSEPESTACLNTPLPDKDSGNVSVFVHEWGGARPRACDGTPSRFE